MCLVYDEKATKDLKRRMKKGKKIFWKLYRKCGGNWLSPPCYSEYSIGYYGISKAVGNLPEHIGNNAEIGPGAFHVFVNKSEAKLFIRYAHEVVVPIRCEVKNLVGASKKRKLSYRDIGNPEEGACFSEIEILKKDFDKALKND